MTNMLAVRHREVGDCINVDLAASGPEFKELMYIPVIPHEAEMQQPA